MNTRIVIELPDDLAQSAHAIAASRAQRVEDVLVEWIGQAMAEPTIDMLPDEAILALCDLYLDAPTQDELSQLLDANREGQVTADDQTHLDALMQQYRRGLVRKAQAWQVAVKRGLKPRLA